MFEELRKRFSKNREQSKGSIRELLSQRAIDYQITGIPKRLIVDDNLAVEFEANGTWYKVFPPSDVLNIDTADKLRHLQIAFGAGSSVGEIKKAFADISKNIASLLSTTEEAVKTKALLEVLSIAQTFSGTMFNNDLGTMRHGAALYICTLFVLPKGRDLNKAWSFEYGDKVIEDWRSENIAAQDFFLLAEVLCSNSRKTTERYFQSKQQVNQKGEN